MHFKAAESVDEWLRDHTVHTMLLTFLKYENRTVSDA